jgi:glycosyltransferase involved in cell wall biosynthesis
MERLNRVAHFEKTYQVYPFLDPKESRRVGAGETFQFRLKWGLNDYPTFLCVARMDEQKRQDILLRAFAKIVKLNPDTRLMLVGDGSFSGLKVGGLASNSPNEWRDKLLALTKELGIEDKVVFTGYLLDDDLQAAYSMCEAFVLPSPVEGFGLTAIESWFHERPIIVTSGAGVSELVNPGVNGYVAVPGSVESLRGYMQEILRGTNDTIQMGKEGALSARVCHAERAVPKLKQVFEDVLAGYPSQK